jgi:hypothetical protein
LALGRRKCCRIGGLTLSLCWTLPKLTLVESAGVFGKFERWLRTELVVGYRPLGALLACFAQGSIVEGLASDADIDVVLVWDGDPPDSSVRPAEGLADEDPAPTVFDQPDFNVDRFWHDGQQFDVKHMPRLELETWVELIESGRGWDGYPTPVVGIHGLLSGVVLVDPDCYLGAVRDRVGRLPQAFVRNTQMSTGTLTGLFTELERCADRGDYLLFHRLAADAIRAGFIGWFAAQGRYWPLEKRLTTRLQLAGRGDLADLEQRAWTEPTLHQRLAAIRQLFTALTEADDDLPR